MATRDRREESVKCPSNVKYLVDVYLISIHSSNIILQKKLKIQKIFIVQNFDFKALNIFVMCICDDAVDWFHVINLDMSTGG